MKQFRKISDGKSITITSPGNYEKGDFVYIDGLYGIAENTVEAGEKLVLLTERNIIINVEIEEQRHPHYPIEMGSLVFYDIENEILTIQRENEYLLIGRIIEANENNIDLFLFNDNIDQNKLNVFEEENVHSYIESKNYIYQIDEQGNIYNKIPFNSEIKDISNLPENDFYDNTFFVSKIIKMENGYILLISDYNIIKIDFLGNIIWSYKPDENSKQINCLELINQNNTLISVNSEGEVESSSVEDGFVSHSFSDSSFYSPGYILADYLFNDIENNYSFYILGNQEMLYFITDNSLDFYNTKTIDLSSTSISFPASITIYNSHMYILDSSFDMETNQNSFSLLQFDINPDNTINPIVNWEYLDIDFFYINKNNGDIFIRNIDGRLQKIDDTGSLIQENIIETNSITKMTNDMENNYYIGTGKLSDNSLIDPKLIKIDNNKNLVYEINNNRRINTIEIDNVIARRLEK